MKALMISIFFLGVIINVNACSLIKDTVQLEEFFADSLNIGRKKYNKIELSRYQTSDSGWITIRFYSKSNEKKWILKQTFGFEKEDIRGCDMEILDFNNDGLKDMTYISNTAARGANEVRRLFIYDKSRDKLVYMKNSEEYPNMLYNKKLNCIDAFLVYGGCSTVFLRIKGDSLVEFAAVEADNDLRVYETDNKGNRKLLSEKKDTKLHYIRFTNYKPLTPSDYY
jgi:hypothetical protein